MDGGVCFNQEETTVWLTSLWLYKLGKGVSSYTKVLETQIWALYCSPWTNLPLVKFEDELTYLFSSILTNLFFYNLFLNGDVSSEFGTAILRTEVQ
jgi:hypothetical protein